MFNDADVQRLVGSVYAAAYDETRWSVCFTGLTRALNATTAGFICVSPGATHSATSLFTGIEEQGIGDYAAHFVARNVWVAPAQVMRPGDVFPDRALYPRRDLRKTEFYNDYLRRYDIASAIGGCISNDEIKSFVSLMRPERLGDWPAWCEQLLGLLLPHLRCAVTIHRELSLAQQQRVVGYELLDALKVPTLVVNRDQKVIVANSAGNRVLNARDGLLDRGGRLDASHRDDGVELSRLIRAALRSETTPWEAAPQWINLRRPSLRRALRVCAAPPPQSLNDIGSGGGVALLFVIEAGRTIGDSTAVLLQTLYQLTPAEAKIAAATARGIAPNEMASRGGISPETARKQLKRVFSKTATTSQQELASLIAALPGSK